MAAVIEEPPVKRTRYGVDRTAAEGQKSTVRLCLVGFGSANRAFAELLLEKGPSLPLKPHVMAILTGKSGRLVASAHDENGLDVAAALKASRIQDLGCAEQGGLSKEDTEHLIRRLADRGLDVLVEAIPTDHNSGEPALGFAEQALRCGVSVVTANKAPAAVALDRLLRLASDGGCQYLHEAACMDGIPIFNMARRCLPQARILGFEGILNSTSNVMLDHLERDPTQSFESALKVAQDMGIAEADPSADIDGWDAAVKCVCLARALGIAPSASLKDVSPVQGIRGIDGEAVAAKLPQRFKMLCRGRQSEDGGVELAVTVELVEPSSPLYSVCGSSSCVTFFTDVLGPLTILQNNPTIRDTGYGLYADLAEVCERLCCAAAN